MIQQLVYKSHAYGPIPLSRRGKDLMEANRKDTQQAIDLGLWCPHGLSANPSRSRGDIVRYISELEQKVNILHASQGQARDYAFEEQIAKKTFDAGIVKGYKSRDKEVIELKLKAEKAEANLYTRLAGAKEAGRYEGHLKGYDQARNEFQHKAASRMGEITWLAKPDPVVFTPPKMPKPSAGFYVAIAAQVTTALASLGALITVITRS